MGGNEEISENNSRKNSSQFELKKNMQKKLKLQVKSKQLLFIGSL